MWVFLCHFVFFLASEAKAIDFSESLFGSKVGVLQEDSPVVPVFESGKALTGSRPWRRPDYSGQQSALGWSPDVFSIPQGMEGTVRFWVDIYTKYGTWQGVLHDAENVEVVYDVIDFRAIDQMTGISETSKAKLKESLVQERKEKIRDSILRLAKVTDPKTLTDADLKIWNQIQKINDPDKWVSMAEISRIRFQLGLKDRMLDAIFYSGRYLEEFENIFRSAGLPIELTRLVFVESSFNVMARSKVGASGLWQIMPYTARPHKMLGSVVDYRNHPFDATKLSARLLRDNYRMLGSWPLAVTGYNHGPTGVKKMVQKYNSTDLTFLVQNVRSRRSFGFASRNFYASFLAALEVEKNADRFFKKVFWSTPLPVRELKLPKEIRYRDLLSWFSGDEDRAQISNPHLSSRVVRGNLNIPSGTRIFVPTSSYASIEAELSGKARFIASPDAPRRGRMHKVARGETLSEIADAYGVSVERLMMTNGLQKPNQIFHGQKIKIPD